MDPQAVIDSMFFSYHFHTGFIVFAEYFNKLQYRVVERKLILYNTNTYNVHSFVVILLLMCLYVRQWTVAKLKGQS